MHNDSIKKLGEKELIKRISEYMPRNQTSDDCAFLNTSDENLLINTDLMVENTHFNNKILSPQDLGWKAVTTNYSDLTSSGCLEFIGINIGLVINPNTSWDWVNKLYKGFSDALNTFGGSILGGDCSKGKNTIISVTAIGKQGKLKLRRNACKPGEILLTTGFHGLSKLGLLLQTNKINNKNKKLSQSLIDQSLKAFSRPKPQLETLRKIIFSQKNNETKHIGCTDSSDGFYQAILDLAVESQCKAIIDYKKIPKSELWPKSNKWDKYYFFGGEDYELLFSLPRPWADNLLKIDKNSTEIGYFLEGIPEVEIKNCPNINITKNNSYKHF